MAPVRSNNGVLSLFKVVCLRRSRVVRRVSCLLAPKVSAPRLACLTTRLRRRQTLFKLFLRVSLKSADEPVARLFQQQLQDFSALSDHAKDALRTSLRLHSHFSNYL
jgi:hypothetical protein